MTPEEYLEKYEREEVSVSDLFDTMSEYSDLYSDSYDYWDW